MTRQRASWQPWAINMERTYVATIKLIIAAGSPSQANSMIQHHLNNKPAILDWGYKEHGRSYRMPAIVARAFPCEVVLPEDYQHAKAEIHRLRNQRFTTPQSAQELAQIELLYEDYFDQIGDESHQVN
jgi:hypothetical protein